MTYFANILQFARTCHPGISSDPCREPTMSDPILLTPGPLTTSATTRHAMQRLGLVGRRLQSADGRRLRGLGGDRGGGDAYACVPLQGSGTFAVEAALGTLVPRDGVVLVPQRRVLRAHPDDPRPARHRRDRAAVRRGCAVDAAAVEAVFAREPRITHVALVHLETSAGILNPLDAIAHLCRRHGKRLIVDAMSSFGALPIALADSGIDALISASGKCLEGVPGMGFAIVRRDALDACAGNARSLALDLHDQYRYLHQTGQWRFTPPTHVVAALRAALDQYLAEGGQPAAARAMRTTAARWSRRCARSASGRFSIRACRRP
jgi:2-aminoethylphosphonate-pyruvate transaminase